MTDPPYGVAYVGKTKDALEIKNDKLDAKALRAFLHEAFAAVLTSAKPGSCWYVASPAGTLGVQFGEVLLEFGILRQQLIWVKDAFVFGHSDYHYRHEPIYYGWTAGGAHQKVPDRNQDTVWEFARPKKSKEHPTMKPVPLIERAIKNSSKPGQIVLDPFGGSGSTLIAAHGLNRKARLIELDPQYVDVICKRFETHTGIVPVLEGSGERSFL